MPDHREMLRGGNNEVDLDRIRAYYETRFRDHGSSARGVDWGEDAAQVSRLAVLVGVARGTNVGSVCDLGCGYGRMVDELRARGIMVPYIGVDLAEDMLVSARRAHAGDANARFEHGDAPIAADLVVASGLFNVRLDHGADAWRQYVDHVLDQMVRAARVGIAANFIPTPSDPSLIQSHLHYETPKRILALLRAHELDARVVTNYGPYDFTVVARRPGTSSVSTS